MELTVLEDTVFNLIRHAAIHLPPDVKEALKKAYLNEESEIGKIQLKVILENVELAEAHKIPLCQDTGIITIYVRAGAELKGLDKVEEAIINAVKRATREVPLRPNAINPINNQNSGDNTGRFSPQIDWEIVSGDILELSVLLKGGGSENVSSLSMLLPGVDFKDLKTFVIETVIRAGAKPCPPTVLGVAFGGGADLAVKLAKKALLRPLNKPNSNPKLAKLEEELLEAINMTGIGPMGLGGKITALKVHVDYAYRHPASFPVAVVFSCWALRRASARIFPDGSVEYLTLNSEEA